LATAQTPPKVTSPPRPEPLHAPGSRSAWCVLDTAFGDGRQFLKVWQQWRDDPLRLPMLHFVGLHDTAQPLPTWPSEIAPHCEGLGNGFHRILLDEGRVSLTLCIGPLQSMLTEQALQADTVFIGDGTWDKWSLKALARHCHTGTQVWVSADGALPASALHEAGFEASAAPHQYAFAPRWKAGTARKALAGNATPARCTVIGAGLAGASVAHALALRGWQVTVLDSHAQPAGGASGLPVGLVVPHVSADDSPRSRMSRAGTRLMLQHAKHLLAEGQAWAPSGVMEHRKDPTEELWHLMAGWVKPAQLVKAWLTHPNIQFVGQAHVAALIQRDGLWHMQDETGRELTCSEHVVLANAISCQALILALAAVADLESDVELKAQALLALHGTLSFGTHPPTDTGIWPKSPVNGNGSLIPHVPFASGAQWFAGSTFEPQAAALADVAAQHRVNYQKLVELLPDVAALLEPCFANFANGKLDSWTGTRCTTHDRLPLVGPIQAGVPQTLWISAGMGSRGLSFSALCAELLMAHMHGDPLPVEARLARGLHVQRTRRKRSVPQTF
jgi:tRNA 5-methylaminomethyl-2-thiouridine biosynthesis bifunctional protein